MSKDECEITITFTRPYGVAEVLLTIDALLMYKDVENSEFPIAFLRYLPECLDYLRETFAESVPEKLETVWDSHALFFAKRFLGEESPLDRPNT